jgi:hypothetical protein
MTRDELEQRMARPAAKAAIARVKAKHAAMDRGKRRGAISDAVDKRSSSKFAQGITDEMAHRYRQQNMPGSKLSIPDVVIILRRGADEMDAGLRAEEDERQARRSAAAGNAPYPAATVSSASGI